MLDPFCGSGRALVEALESGRQAVGFELSESFAELARANVAEFISRKGDSTSHDTEGMTAA